MRNTERTKREVEVSPGELSHARALAIGIVVAVVAVIVVLFLFVRAPLLLGMGEIAGPSRTLAVVLGWAVWGVPMVASLAFGRLARDQSGLSQRSKLLLLALVIVLWLPAITLLPGRGSAAEQQFDSLATAQAPLVAQSLVAGLGLGAVATLLSLPAVALTLIPVHRHPQRFAHLDRVIRPAVMIGVSLLGLGAGLAIGRPAPPGLAVDELWPPGHSWTFNGTEVRRLGAAHSGGCAAVVGGARAAALLDHDGCGGSERGLFTDSRGDALVAVAVIAMPTDQLAHQAAQQLTRLNAFVKALPTPPSVGRDLADTTVPPLTEDIGDELLIIDAGHADGRSRYIDTAPERTLGDAVANTIIYGVTGA